MIDLSPLLVVTATAITQVALASGPNAPMYSRVVVIGRVGYYNTGFSFKINDASEIQRLASFFPGVGMGKRSDCSKQLEPYYELRFHRRGEKAMTVYVKDDCWSEGAGDWPLNKKFFSVIEHLIVKYKGRKIEHN